MFTKLYWKHLKVMSKKSEWGWRLNIVHENCYGNQCYQETSRIFSKCFLFGNSDGHKNFRLVQFFVSPVYFFHHEINNQSSLQKSIPKVKNKCINCVHLRSYINCKVDELKLMTAPFVFLLGDSRFHVVSLTQGKHPYSRRIMSPH